MSMPLQTRLALIALMALSCSAQAADDAPAERTFLVDTLASYADNLNISDNAKAECGLERLIPQAVEKFAPKYKVQLSLASRPAGAPDAATRVALQVTTLVAGRAGPGFGGRWVESELGVAATVTQGDQTLFKTNLACKAGLGANPFANLKACDRLERCAEQIGAKAARWLKTVASRKADAAPVASEEAASSPDTSASK